MTHHLLNSQIEAYFQRTLDPAALLAADDHLAACAACRERAERSASSIRQLHRSLTVAHLTQEQFELYADGRLNDADANAHLRECPECLAEADDLTQFVRAGTSIKPAGTMAWWRLAMAAAICAAVVGGALLLRSTREPAPVVRKAEASLLPDDLRDLRDQALRVGRIAVPPEISALRGRTETQLGSSTAPQAELLFPVGTAVLSSRPAFRWRPFPGAQQYEVSLFTISGRPVARSGPLHQTSWTPGSDLAGGEVYVWELSVAVNGKQIIAPRPPAPQARFLVIAEAERLRLADIATRFPSEHVLLGVLYAQAGALDDARRELRAAVAAGQSGAVPLLKSLE
jgi:hypothetical protein